MCNSKACSVPLSRSRSQVYLQRRAGSSPISLGASTHSRRKSKVSGKEKNKFSGDISPPNRIHVYIHICMYVCMYMYV